MKRKPRRKQATPIAHMILSKRMADHRPHDMICELVDDAFDADAQRVWMVAAAQKAEVLQLTSLALELEDYLDKMSSTPGSERVAEAPPRDEVGEEHSNAPDPAAEAPEEDAVTHDGD